MKNKTAEQILDENLVSTPIRLRGSKESILQAMDEYMCQEVDKITDLFTKPLAELKPLEDLWRKENSPNQFIIPDAIKFYKWIVSKIIK